MISSTALYLNLTSSALGLLLVLFLIPKAAPVFLRVRLFGKDLNKSSLLDTKVPESLGIIPATVFLLIVTCFQLLLHDVSLLVQYNAALVSICLMTFLGFADDVLNLRWRYKLLLPAVASLPIVVSYSGTTVVIIPSFLRSYLPESLDTGYFYLFYLVSLLLFCSNSINIYAGINGLEVGQSVIIGLTLVFYNLYQLFNQPELHQMQHFLALLFLVPFVFCSLGLLYHNKYPSKVFVGDSFTYFAGITLGVSAILGRMTKLLLLLFIPQLLNFLYSLPQLVGIVPCPRHRLPKYNEKTGLLEGVPFHMNLINLVLRVMGDMSERNLFFVLMLFQVVCSVGGLYLRKFFARFEWLSD
ncbi:hypothetical protein RCL1_004212 [Eukaryota sp. TZLM3-RCL]